jgi:T5orf172 domain-containing protein
MDDLLVVIFVMFCAVVWLARQGWRVAGRFWPSVRIDFWDYMTGTVYIARDRSLDVQGEIRVIKIGVTRRRDVRVRMIEIARDMGGDPVCIWKIDHVPFPKAVEFVSHRLLERYRIVWPRGSRRGTEWFHAVGNDGLERAISAVGKACRRVRRKAKARKRWSDKADSYISVWRLSERGISRTYPFRTHSAPVEGSRSQGGKRVKPPTTKTRTATSPTRPGSPRRAISRMKS